MVGAAFYADTPARTFGEAFRQNRWQARLALGSVEILMVAVWATAHFGTGWDPALLPAGAAPAGASVGLLLSAAGVGLAVWAKVRLGRWFSATFAVKEGHELVTDGPYAITRHPIYTGLLAAVTGGALVWNSVFTLVLAAALAIPFFLHTVFEEAMFEKHFGQPYFDYQRRVPRLVPFTRRNIRRES